jgi:hypothetical protein
MQERSPPLLVVNHDIVRLDVAVHDPIRVRELERFQQLVHVVTDVKIGKCRIKNLATQTRKLPTQAMEQTYHWTRTLKSVLLMYSNMRHGVFDCGSRTCGGGRLGSTLNNNRTPQFGSARHDIKQPNDVGAPCEVLQDLDLTLD